MLARQEAQRNAAATSSPNCDAALQWHRHLAYQRKVSSSIRNTSWSTAVRLRFISGYLIVKVKAVDVVMLEFDESVAVTVMV